MLRVLIPNLMDILKSSFPSVLYFFANIIFLLIQVCNFKMLYFLTNPIIFNVNVNKK